MILYKALTELIFRSNVAEASVLVGGEETSGAIHELSSGLHKMDRQLHPHL